MVGVTIGMVRPFVAGKRMRPVTSVSRYALHAFPEQVAATAAETTIGPCLEAPRSGHHRA
jgi:hypothetical protein